MKTIHDYVVECIENDLSPADFSLINDGQMQWIVENIEKLVKNDKSVILDYGCGNMRLLNALSNRGFNYEYYGVDVSIDDCMKQRSESYSNCHLIPANRMHDIPYHSNDIVCLCNVTHEISILEFSEILLNSMFLLKPEGYLIYMDMSVLPKGELLGLPYFPKEIMELFSIDECTVQTRNGYPVVGCVVPASSIPDPYSAIPLLYELLEEKRDSFSYYALDCVNQNGVEFFEKQFQKMHSRMEKENLLAYSLYLSAVANYRLVEYSQCFLDDENNEFYIDLIELYISTLESENKQITIREVYEKLFPKYSHIQITIKLKLLFSMIETFFMKEEGNQLVATDRLEYFLNYSNYNYDDLRRIGPNLANFCVYS